jgi:bifunctional DNase/RNase
LIGCAISIGALAGASSLVPAGVTKTVAAVANTGLAENMRAYREPQSLIQDDFIQMDIRSVSLIKGQPVVLLEEKDGGRYLVMNIGSSEARAIYAAIEGLDTPRPLTADLTHSIVDSLGATVGYVAIDNILDDIFYAHIALTHNWTNMEIDSRPSDAIAVALRVNAPIYATDTVLQREGIPKEQTEVVVNLSVWD